MTTVSTAKLWMKPQPCLTSAAYRSIARIQTCHDLLCSHDHGLNILEIPTPWCSDFINSLTTLTNSFYSDPVEATSTLQRPLCSNTIYLPRLRSNPHFYCIFFAELNISYLHRGIFTGSFLHRPTGLASRKTHGGVRHILLVHVNCCFGYCTSPQLWCTYCTWKQKLPNANNN